MPTIEEQSKQKSPPLREKVHIANFFKKNLESYIEFEEKWSEALAKFLTKSFGTLKFLILTLIFLLLWILVNLGLFPGITPFDLYPFVWLLTLVQLFSIVLSIVILISQSQETRITEIRQQMDFEINVRAEHEITKILNMIEQIHTKLGIAKVDMELEQMKEMTNISTIKKEVEQVIKEKNNTIGID